MIPESYIAELIQEIHEIIKAKKPFNKEVLSRLKIKLCTKHKVKNIPTDIEIYMSASDKDAQFLKKYLQTKPTRTISGVAVVAVMSKPMPCPHADKQKGGIGPCAMCPGGPASEFGDIPQSYTGKEPATMRAIRAGYDPYIQVFNRLEQYIVTGHVPDKIELIVMGGTFISFPKQYRDKFITDCFRAMNDFSTLFFGKGKKNSLDFNRFKRFFELPGEVGDPGRTERIQTRLKKLKHKSTTLEKEQKRNERSNIRCVGLTLETRPDYGSAKHGNEMLRLGATRVELGIQSVYDDALKAIKRGHTVQDNIRSIRELKDLGFKLNFHIMLGLPGVNERQDLAALNELFDNPDYRPDMLKLYPCMVLKGTELYRSWKAKKYKPLTTQKAAEMIAEFKQRVPEYCRIMRVQRDIPTYQTEAGVDKTNLRQYIEKIMQHKGIKCRCIRCREAGRANNIERPKFFVRDYDASHGKEFFISIEDEKNDVLLGFCRLRFPCNQMRKEMTKRTALIRELHVYGAAAALGEKEKGTKMHANKAVQHKGIGRRLLKKAEMIAAKHKKDKIVIISGIGVREYYKKLGYKKEGPYMVKDIGKK